MNPEKRSEVRLLCADMLEIQWRDPAAQVHHATALLEDISGSGACLQLDAPLPLGVELRMKCRQRQFNGLVRYCVYREIGYFVGIEFAHESRWSPRTFRPQHLLDLQWLAETARRPGN